MVRMEDLYMENKTKRVPHLFFQLIIPYTCVLLVPIIIWLLSNFFVIDNNEKKMINLVEKSLENNINMVDANLRQIEDVMYRVSQNTVFDIFYEREQLKYSEIMELQQVFRSYSVEDSLLHLLYIYGQEYNRLMSFYAFYPKAPEFITSYILADESANEMWIADFEKRMMEEGYHSQETLLQSGRELAVLPYTRTLPMYHQKRKNGSITAIVNVEKLLSYFESIIEEGEGSLYVFDGEGRQIMHQGDVYEMDIWETGTVADTVKKVSVRGEKMYRFVLQSPENHWQYYVFLNRDYILRDVGAINNLLHFINILGFTLGMVLCMYFTYGRNKSYKNIMHMLGIEKKSLSGFAFRTNEFEFWRPYIGNLLDENRKARESIDKLSDEGKHRALRMLLLGHVQSEPAANQLLKESKLALNGKHYLAWILRTEAVYNVEGESNKNLFLSHALDEYLNGTFYVYIVDNKTMAVLMSFDEEPEEYLFELKKQIVNMNLEVFHRYRMNVLLGVGEAADCLCGIADSYNQALEVVSYNRITDSTHTLFYRELPEGQNMYYYPIELENGLITAISSGKAAEASRIINVIYEENFVKRSLSVPGINELIGEVYSSLNKVRQTCFRDEERLDYGRNDFTVRSFFEYARDFVFAACENRHVIEEDMSNAKFKQMLEYINENYGRNDLSRDTLAAAFGLTDTTYISKLFKKYLNENFFAYLERIRIENACLLLDEHCPVKDVAERVGYLSDVSFRRAFKKRMGYSPSDYVNRKSTTEY